MNLHHSSQASHEQIRAQTPHSPGAERDIWLYVLPVSVRPGQQHSSDALETLGLPAAREFSAQQQQQQRGSDFYQDASSAQAPLHRLAADNMTGSYRSPRCLSCIKQLQASAFLSSSACLTFASRAVDAFQQPQCSA